MNAIKMCGALALSAVAVYAGQHTFTVEKEGRRIQRDGFLLEWRLDRAERVDSRFDVRLDAMDTPEGLAGYVRYTSHDTCKGWTLRFYPRIGVWRRFVEMTVDSVGRPDALFAIDTVLTHSAVHVAVEWMLPWDTLALDSTGAYQIGLTLSSGCGDTLDPILVSGTHMTRPYRGIWTPRIIAQLCVIGVLFALYAFVRVRAKKYAKLRRPNGLH